MSAKGWKLEVHQRDGNRCKICGSTKNLTVHHKLPVARGGKSSLENCVCWCKWCHCAFHNKWGLTISDDFGNPVEEYYGFRVRRKKEKKGRRR